MPQVERQGARLAAGPGTADRAAGSPLNCQKLPRSPTWTSPTVPLMPSAGAGHLAVAQAAIWSTPVIACISVRNPALARSSCWPEPKG